MGAKAKKSKEIDALREYVMQVLMKVSAHIHILYVASRFSKAQCIHGAEHVRCKREARKGAIKKSKSERICLVREWRRRRGCAVHLMQG